MSLGTAVFLSSVLLSLRNSTIDLDGPAFMAYYCPTCEYGARPLLREGES